MGLIFSAQSETETEPATEFVLEPNPITRSVPRPLPAPPWSLVVLVPSRTSGPPTVPQTSTSSALLGSSFPPAPSMFSLRSSGLPSPPWSACLGLLGLRYRPRPHPQLHLGCHLFWLCIRQSAPGHCLKCPSGVHPPFAGFSSSLCIASYSSTSKNPPPLYTAGCGFQKDLLVHLLVFILCLYFYFLCSCVFLLTTSSCDN